MANVPVSSLLLQLNLARLAGRRGRTPTARPDRRKGSSRSAARRTGRSCRPPGVIALRCLLLFDPHIDGLPLEPLLAADLEGGNLRLLSHHVDGLGAGPEPSKRRGLSSAIYIIPISSAAPLASSRAFRAGKMEARPFAFFVGVFVARKADEDWLLCVEQELAAFDKPGSYRSFVPCLGAGHRVTPHHLVIGACMGSAATASRTRAGLSPAGTRQRRLTHHKPHSVNPRVTARVKTRAFA